LEPVCYFFRNLDQSSAFGPASERHRNLFQIGITKIVIALRQSDLASSKTYIAMAIGDSTSSLSSVGASYASVQGGANSLARSIDASQYAAAVYMVKIATQNMDRQFSQFLTVFSDVA